MNSFFHFATNALAGLLLGFNILEITIITLSGILIDIDHLVYQSLILKNKTLREIRAWHKKEYSLMRPHFYIFHQVEVLFVLGFISYLVSRGLFLVFVGFAIHLVFDMINHLIRHRKLSCLKYFLLMYWLKEMIIKK